MALGIICSLLLVVFVSLSYGDFDLLKPIVKLSPDAQNSGDHFGYSAVAHQLFSNSTGMSYEDILSQTLIISGAPHGIYPGGLDLLLDWRACQEHNTSSCNAYNMELMNYTDDQIKECYRTLRSGLVYSCALNNGKCGSLLNGTLVFDSIGNYQTSCNHDNMQSKTHQLMGSLVYSNNKYLVVCAQLQRFRNTAQFIVPNGVCVVTDGNLQSIINSYRACLTFGDGYDPSVGGICNSGTSSLMIDDKLVMGGPLSIGRGVVVDFPNLSSPSGRNSYLLPSSSKSDEYLGYSMTTGNITNDQNVITSQPVYRDSNQLPVGRVVVYKQRNIFQSLTGYQGGEYFGYSLATADLNGDGWDDLLVGAPFYTEFTSPIQVAVGRVYVFLRQDDGTLNRSAVLSGSTAKGQFGTAITNVGDLNEDGYEDFAVGAPFEGSGVVYIYYGQQMDQQGSIVNTTYQQRIDGSSLVSQVTNLTSVSSFGFSLSGSVDVDQNEYRDLVIGAFESQAVFVLRSIPIATASIQIISSVSELKLNSYRCRHNNAPVTCFEVTVCSQYTGKGIQTGFNTTYQLSEVTQTGQTQRLYFSTQYSNTITRNISFGVPNVEVCDSNITVYVRNTTDISDFKLRAMLLGVTRDKSPVNTNTFPINLNIFPDIKVTPRDITIPVFTECGDDRICDSNLKIAISKPTYRDDQMELVSDQSQYVIGNTTIVDLTFMISNSAEDAFQSFISIELPQTYFIRVESLNASLRCNATSQNGTIVTYTCTGIKSPLTKSDGALPFILRLHANTSLTGDEPALEIPISVNIPPQMRNRENSSFYEDNSNTVRVSFISMLSYTVSVFYSTNSISYYGNGTGNLNNISSNLGQKLNMFVSLINHGPSPFSGSLDIYIPAQKPDVTGNYYYYYPVELTLTGTTDSILKCDQSPLNPNNYNIAEDVARRSKRSLKTKPRGPLLRKRQTMEYNLDCMVNPNMCIKVQCNITGLKKSVSVNARIRGYVDERFFQGKTVSYNFRAFADGSVTDGFTVTNSSGEASINILYNRLMVVGPGDTGQDFPYIYLIIPIVLAIIFIIILAIALYCLGFFKRRKTKKEQEEMDPYLDNYDPNNIDDEVKDSKDFSTTL